jgi:hypothetical protein
MHSVEIDGSSLVILVERARLIGASFEVLEKGTQTYDGEVLRLEFETGGNRVVTKEEQRDMLNVTHLNRIPECTGCDVFILRQAN